MSGQNQIQAQSCGTSTIIRYFNSLRSVSKIPGIFRIRTIFSVLTGVSMLLPGKLACIVMLQMRKIPVSVY